jgi:F-type H+-transporting ATPase subunit alpha
LSVYAATKGYLDALPIEKVREYEQTMHDFVQANHSDILKNIREKGSLAEGEAKTLEEVFAELATDVLAKAEKESADSSQAALATSSSGSRAAQAAG